MTATETEIPEQETPEQAPAEQVEQAPAEQVEEAPQESPEQESAEESPAEEEPKAPFLQRAVEAVRGFPKLVVQRAICAWEEGWSEYDRRATAEEGLFWGSHPASLRTLKAFVAAEADTPSLIRKGFQYLYGGFSLAVCTLVYGLLWTVRKPISSPSGGPPTLGHLRTDIRSRGTVGRIYGYSLVGWLHLLAYGLVWTVQLPARLGVALLLWVPALLIQLVF